MHMRTALTGVAAFILFSPGLCEAEILARTTAGQVTVSLVASADVYAPDCQLDLIAEGNGIRQTISHKRPGLLDSTDPGCNLFGSARMHTSPTSDRKSSYVIVEAERGGDGDHTGPLVSVYLLTPSGFHLLGEPEIYDASYHRRDGILTAVTGDLHFTFCRFCDGASSSDDDFYIPVEISITPTGLHQRCRLSHSQRIALRKKFLAQIERALKEEGSTDYREYVTEIEKRFMAALDG